MREEYALVSRLVLKLNQGACAAGHRVDNRHCCKPAEMTAAELARFVHPLFVTFEIFHKITHILRVEPISFWRHSRKFLYRWLATLMKQAQKQTCAHCTARRPPALHLILPGRNQTQFLGEMHYLSSAISSSTEQISQKN
jgi:hypothetical protein